MVFSRRLKNPLEKAPFLWFLSLGAQRKEQEEFHTRSLAGRQIPMTKKKKIMKERILT